MSTVCIKHGNANAVSRLSFATTLPDPPVPNEVEHFDGTTVTLQHIKSWISRDPIMSKVCLYTSIGIALRLTKIGKMIYDGCVLWGAPVCIPP